MSIAPLLKPIQIVPVLRYTVTVPSIRDVPLLPSTDADMYPVLPENIKLHVTLDVLIQYGEMSSALIEKHKMLDKVNAISKIEMIRFFIILFSFNLSLLYITFENRFSYRKFYFFCINLTKLLLCTIIYMIFV